MLSLGASQPWQDVLQVMTGERRMTARPLLDYFRPLKEWLEEDNARDGDGVGWGDSWRHASGGRAEVASGEGRAGRASRGREGQGEPRGGGRGGLVRPGKISCSHVVMALLPIISCG